MVAHDSDDFLKEDLHQLQHQRRGQHVLLARAVGGAELGSEGQHAEEVEDAAVLGREVGRDVLVGDDHRHGAADHADAFGHKVLWILDVNFIEKVPDGVDPLCERPAVQPGPPHLLSVLVYVNDNVIRALQVPLHPQGHCVDGVKGPGQGVLHALPVRIDQLHQRVYRLGELVLLGKVQDLIRGVVIKVPHVHLQALAVDPELGADLPPAVLAHLDLTPDLVKILGLLPLVQLALEAERHHQLLPRDVFDRRVGNAHRG